MNTNNASQAPDTPQKNGEGFPLHVCAIDVGGTKIAGAILKYESRTTEPEIVIKKVVSTCAQDGGNKVLERIGNLCESLIDDAQVAAFEISGVGIGTAGRVNANTGEIAFANDIMPGWSGQPVKAALQERLQLPVAVINDVQAHALGEARFGAARTCSECIVVAAGTGLGGAIISGGRVLLGTHGFAGELGHTYHPMAAGITCACGNEGHLESIASGSGIEAQYVAKGGKQLTGAEISAAANNGEGLAKEVIHNAGASLGGSIGTWANMLDPELVVVSGSVTRAGQIWWDALLEGFESQAPGGQSGLTIVKAKLGDSAPLIGAAENLLDIVFDC